MRITLSKAQWQFIGNQTGWLDKSAGIVGPVVGPETGSVPSKIPANEINKKPCLFNKRLCMITEVSRKEYNIRVYQTGESDFEVWSFFGKLYDAQFSHGRTLTSFCKGIFKSASQAIGFAEHLVTQKQMTGYADANRYFNLPAVTPALPCTIQAVQKNQQPQNFVSKPDKVTGQL